MLNRDDIARACRHNDAIVEESGDLPGFFTERDVDFDGLTYLAEQRALRVAMILDGQDPNPSRPRAISLPPHLNALMPMFASLFIDGFAAGRTAEHDPQFDMPDTSNEQTGDTS